MRPLTEEFFSLFLVADVKSFFYAGADFNSLRHIYIYEEDEENEWTAIMETSCSIL